MVEQTISVTSSLEARPAAMLVQTANKFSCNIKLTIENKTVNAKSIMGIISLGILDGQELTIKAEGDDADLAVSELTQFLNMV